MRYGRRLTIPLAALALAGATGCVRDVPTGIGDGARAVAPTSAALSVVLAHEDDGGEHTFSCGGLTPTLWPGMEVIPEGASITPLAHDGDEGDAEHESGYYIVGTPGPDVILATEGRDRVEGGDGDDVICTGGAPDYIDGGRGSDAIFAGGGPDEIVGGPGEDVIAAGGGPDRVYGGRGEDVIRGDGGPDQVFGELGDDQILGGPGCDVLDGGIGDDVIRGGYGNDTIIGGVGDDELFGDTGFDLFDVVMLGTDIVVPGDQTPDAPGAGGGHDGGGGDEGDCGGHEEPTP